MHPHPTFHRDRRWSALAGPLAALLTLGTLAHLALPLTTPPAAYGEDQSTQESMPQVGAALNKRFRCLARAGVERWHASGHRGRGVKVAVLDSGFRGYRNHLGKSLPSNVVVRSFRADGNLEARDSQHGILCGEVVHSLAPDAELLFANWDGDSPQGFLEAVRWARQQGAKILTCSIIMPSWSDGEGGGPVHAALTQALARAQPADSLCFASAGNTAKRHWSGPFHDHGDGLHEWSVGQTDNVLTPWGGGERASVEVCWNGSANFDLFIYDKDKDREVASSVARSGEQRRCAVARFQPETGHKYYLRVKSQAKSTTSFHCVALHSGLAYASARGSICFPADGPNVIAVGAVDENDRRMSYSSCGPNSICPKPDLVAPVPFPSTWRDRPFGGTSAASPQAAGIAAILWSRNPTWTAERSPHRSSQFRTGSRHTRPRLRVRLWPDPPPL